VVFVILTIMAYVGGALRVAFWPLGDCRRSARSDHHHGFSLMGNCLTSPSLAGLLTVAGYSINDKEGVRSRP
jgi:hypothetical protein